MINFTRSLNVLKSFGGDQNSSNHSQAIAGTPLTDFLVHYHEINLSDHGKVIDQMLGLVYFCIFFTSIGSDL